MILEHQQILDIQEQIPALFEQFRNRIPWLQAIGIGKKRLNGQSTGDDVLAFFVGEKLTTDELSEEQRIPELITLQVQGSALQLETDVVEVQPSQFLQLCRCTLERPARGGNCVSPVGAGWLGTLGGIVTHPSTGRHHIVSNAHVLAGFNHFPVNHPIAQPAGGARIARLKQSSQWSTTAIMRADAAVAEVVRNQDVSRQIFYIGVPQGIAPPSVGLPVQKSGTRTCLTRDTIQYVGLTLTVGAYRFRDVFLVNLLADFGDSGSLVLDEGRRIIGLVFARVGQMTACNDIANVVTDLGLGGWIWT